MGEGNIVFVLRHQLMNGVVHLGWIICSHLNLSGNLSHMHHDVCLLGDCKSHQAEE